MVKKVRRHITKLIAAALCFSLIIPASAATQQSNNTGVQPLTESDVSAYIQAATRTRTEVLNGETVTYYFGENFGVAKDSTGYYLAQCEGSPIRLSVNGRELETKMLPVASPRIDLPTAWSTVVDTGRLSVDIAGLTVTAAGLAIELYMSTAIPGGGVAGSIISTAISQLGYTVLPDGYYATVRFVSKYRIIKIHPSIAEYDDTLTIHMGPGNNKLKHLLVNNHSNYEKRLED